jgi:hypothetical protein
MWYRRYEDAGVPVQLFQLISCRLCGKKDQSFLENRYCCPESDGRLPNRKLW